MAKNAHAYPFRGFLRYRALKAFPLMDFISKGSELCQTLGFHRDVSIQKDKREDFRYKQFLFWSIYFIDKSLSLRLGRPSTIPDWDITVPRPSADTFNSEPALAYFVVSVETARCQGNIYEMLYSPKSMAEPDEIKLSRIEAVLSDLRDLETMIWETNVNAHTQATSPKLLILEKGKMV